MAESENIHAACVRMNRHGVLIMGPSGSGKSDLVLRILDEAEGWPDKTDTVLIADDRVIVSKSNSHLCASAPPNLRGLLEVRGFGIVSVPFADRCRVDLIVKLTVHEGIERMPDGFFGTYEHFGVVIPSIRLDPATASATARLRLAIRQLGSAV